MFPRANTFTFQASQQLGQGPLLQQNPQLQCQSNQQQNQKPMAMGFRSYLPNYNNSAGATPGGWSGIGWSWGWGSQSQQSLSLGLGVWVQNSALNMVNTQQSQNVLGFISPANNGYTNGVAATNSTLNIRGATSMLKPWASPESSIPIVQVQVSAVNWGQEPNVIKSQHQQITHQQPRESPTSETDLETTTAEGTTTTNQGDCSNQNSNSNQNQKQTHSHQQSHSQSLHVNHINSWQFTPLTQTPDDNFNQNQQQQYQQSYNQQPQIQQHHQQMHWSQSQAWIRTNQHFQKVHSPRVPQPLAQYDETAGSKSSVTKLPWTKLLNLNMREFQKKPEIKGVQKPLWYQTQLQVPIQKASQHQHSASGMLSLNQSALSSQRSSVNNFGIAQQNDEVICWQSSSKQSQNKMLNLNIQPRFVGEFKSLDSWNNVFRQRSLNVNMVNMTQSRLIQNQGQFQFQGANRCNGNGQILGGMHPVPVNRLSQQGFNQQLQQAYGSNNNSVSVSVANQQQQQIAKAQQISENTRTLSKASNSHINSVSESNSKDFNQGQEQLNVWHWLEFPEPSSPKQKIRQSKQKSVQPQAFPNFKSTGTNEVSQSEVEVQVENSFSSQQSQRQSQPNPKPLLQWLPQPQFPPTQMLSQQRAVSALNFAKPAQTQQVQQQPWWQFNNFGNGNQLQQGILGQFNTPGWMQNGKQQQNLLGARGILGQQQNQQQNQHKQQQQNQNWTQQIQVQQQTNKSSLATSISQTPLQHKRYDAIPPQMQDDQIVAIGHDNRWLIWKQRRGLERESRERADSADSYVSQKSTNSRMCDKDRAKPVHYQLKGMLGRGAYGCVFLGIPIQSQHQQQNGGHQNQIQQSQQYQYQQVAIKEIKAGQGIGLPDMTPDKLAFELFCLESIGDAYGGAQYQFWNGTTTTGHKQKQKSKQIKDFQNVPRLLGSSTYNIGYQSAIVRFAMTRLHGKALQTLLEQPSSPGTQSSSSKKPLLQFDYTDDIGGAVQFVSRLIHQLSSVFQRTSKVCVHRDINSRNILCQKTNMKEFLEQLVNNNNNQSGVASVSNTNQYELLKQLFLPSTETEQGGQWIQNKLSDKQKKQIFQKYYQWKFSIVDYGSATDQKKFTESEWDTLPPTGESKQWCPQTWKKLYNWGKLTSVSVSACQQWNANSSWFNSISNGQQQQGGGPGIVLTGQNRQQSNSNSKQGIQTLYEFVQQKQQQAFIQDQMHQWYERSKLQQDENLVVDECGEILSSGQTSKESSRNGSKAKVKWTEEQKKLHQQKRQLLYLEDDRCFQYRLDQYALIIVALEVFDKIFLGRWCNENDKYKDADKWSAQNTSPQYIQNGTKRNKGLTINKHNQPPAENIGIFKPLPLPSLNVNFPRSNTFHNPSNREWPNFNNALSHFQWVQGQQQQQKQNQKQNQEAPIIEEASSKQKQPKVQSPESRLYEKLTKFKSSWKRYYNVAQTANSKLFAYSKESIENPHSSWRHQQLWKSLQEYSTPVRLSQNLKKIDLIIDDILEECNDGQIGQQQQNLDIDKKDQNRNRNRNTNSYSQKLNYNAISSFFHLVQRMLIYSEWWTWDNIYFETEGILDSFYPELEGVEDHYYLASAMVMDSGAQWQTNGVADHQHNEECDEVDQSIDLASKQSPNQQKQNYSPPLEGDETQDEPQLKIQHQFTYGNGSSSEENSGEIDTNTNTKSKQNNNINTTKSRYEEKRQLYKNMRKQRSKSSVSWSSGPDGSPSPDDNIDAIEVDVVVFQGGGAKQQQKQVDGQHFWQMEQMELENEVGVDVGDVNSSPVEVDVEVCWWDWEDQEQSFDNDNEEESTSQNANSSSASWNVDIRGETEQHEDEQLIQVEGQHQQQLHQRHEDEDENESEIEQREIEIESEQVKQEQENETDQQLQKIQEVMENQNDAQQKQNYECDNQEQLEEQQPPRPESFRVSPFSVVSSNSISSVTSSPFQMQLIQHPNQNQQLVQPSARLLPIVNGAQAQQSPQLAQNKQSLSQSLLQQQGLQVQQGPLSSRRQMINNYTLTFPSPQREGESKYQQYQQLNNQNQQPQPLLFRNSSIQQLGLGQQQFQFGQR